MKYLIVIEQPGRASPRTPLIYQAVSQLPGTREAVEHEMTEAIAFHVEGLKAEGLDVPSPNTSSSYVDVPA